MALETLLRPALEAALAVAREGEDETPSVSAPVPLRPFLRFAKLPARALAFTRRALDADDEFRARVAEAAAEGNVGRAGWIYLTRPEGWEEELATIVASAELSAREQADRKAEHDARRRLAAVQEAARKAEEGAALARAGAGEATAALGAERRARQAADEAAAAAARRVDHLTAERDRARRDTTAARADADALRAKVAELEVEVRGVQAALAAAEAEAERASAVAQAAAVEAAAAGYARAKGRGVAGGTEGGGAVDASSVDAVAVEPAGVDAASVGGAAGVGGPAAIGTSGSDAGLRGPGAANAGPALRDAGEAASRLADALRAAAAAFGEAPVDSATHASNAAETVAGALSDPPRLPTSPAPSPPPAAVSTRPISRTGPGRIGSGLRQRGPVLRQAVPLPPAVYDDSLEAAEHLVRVPGMVLVVDGYNVSLSGWPDLPLPEQRRRLVDALTGLAARTGADTRVVFDGAEVAMPGIVATTAKPVHVTFSAPGVDADEVMIDLVGQLPPNRPVLVATSDRRVQHEVRRAGANVISTEQLLTVLRR